MNNAKKHPGAFGGLKKKIEHIDNSLTKHPAYRVTRTLGYWVLFVVGHALAFAWMCVGTLLHGDSNDPAARDEEEEDQPNYRSVIDEQGWL